MILVEDSETGCPSLITVRIGYLFALQILCFDVCKTKERKAGSIIFVIIGILRVLFLLVSEGWWAGRKSHLGPAEIASFCARSFRKLLWWNLGAHGRYLTIQPSLTTA